MSVTDPHTPQSERHVFDAGILRIIVLGAIALIVGSMVTYDLIRPRSTTTVMPFPRPQQSIVGAKQELNSPSTFDTAHMNSDES
jgi:hypothetical protein